MSDDTKPSLVEQVLSVVDKLTQAESHPAPDVPLPSGMSIQREEPDLRSDGTVVNNIKVVMAEHHHHNTLNNTGTVGNMAGERIENSQADVRSRVALPPDIAKAFEGFETGIAQAKLSEAQKQALDGQVGVLKEEAGKSPDQRNSELVSGTVKGLELTATATEAVKALWDAFGGTITGFFS